MSQEEHILHELKEMHHWIGHADRQMSRVKWLLYFIIVLLVFIVWLILVK